MPKSKSKNPPTRKHYPAKKEQIGILVSPALRQQIRDYGAYMRSQAGNDEGAIVESTAARTLILIGLSAQKEALAEFSKNSGAGD